MKSLRISQRGRGEVVASTS